MAILQFQLGRSMAEFPAARSVILS